MGEATPARELAFYGYNAGVPMEKISAVIITFNEEEYIGDCISSLWPVSDEVIVLDSCSTDRTVLIARYCGATVRQAPFEGYIEQKNKATALCQYNFVLSLDADERLSPQLARSIIAAKKEFRHCAYLMSRHNSYCGKFINHGLWYPNRKIRLFDKRVAHWGGTNPHDKIVLPRGVGSGSLKGDIIHLAYKTVAEHKQRNGELSRIAATTMFTSGRRTHWSKIVLSPAWSFVHGYIIRLGFLDGWSGLRVAWLTASQSFLKYHKLQLLYRAQKDQTPKVKTSINSE